MIVIGGSGTAAWPKLLLAWDTHDVIWAVSGLALCCVFLVSWSCYVGLRSRLRCEVVFVGPLLMTDDRLRRSVDILFRWIPVSELTCHVGHRRNHTSLHKI